MRELNSIRHLRYIFWMFYFMLYLKIFVSWDTIFDFNLSTYEKESFHFQFIFVKVQVIHGNNFCMQFWCYNLTSFSFWVITKLFTFSAISVTTHDHLIRWELAFALTFVIVIASLLEFYCLIFDFSRVFECVWHKCFNLPLIFEGVFAFFSCCLLGFEMLWTWPTKSRAGNSYRYKNFLSVNLKF